MRRVLVISLSGLLWAAVPLVARADVPQLIRYQGTLVDAQQVALEGPYTLTFRLYDAAEGGTNVWEEIQANVPCTSGQFSVLLGQVRPLELAFDQDLWLSIAVNTDGEMSPRQRLSSVPYAQRAKVAESALNMKTSAIEDDENNFVPIGGIILWTGASCPAGYVRFAGVDGKFVVAGATFNAAAGGANTHDHGGTTGSHTLTVSEIPAHSHGIRGHYNGGGEGPNWFPNTSDGVYTNTESAGGNQGHSHTMASADSRPEFATMLFCQKQ